MHTYNYIIYFSNRISLWGRLVGVVQGGEAEAQLVEQRDTRGPSRG